MKRIFSIIAILTITAFTSTAQRYGTIVGRDNTGRVLTFGNISKSDAASATVDTITTALTNSVSSKGFYNTTVTFTVSDSAVLSISSTANSQPGDRLTVVLNNSISSAASFVNFLGYSALASKWKMASTGTKIILASLKSAVLQFYFDGTYWNEVSRCVQ